MDRMGIMSKIQSECGSSRESLSESENEAALMHLRYPKAREDASQLCPKDLEVWEDEGKLQASCIALLKSSAEHRAMSIIVKGVKLTTRQQ